MIDRGKKNILGILIDAVDYDAAVRRVLEAAHAGRPLSVTALAVHGLMTGVMDRTHKYRLNQFDLIVPDGQPVRWALNRLHRSQLVDRVYGPNLMLKVCEQAAKESVPIFLLGADQPMLDKLSCALREKYPALQIAGMRPSKFRRLEPHEKQELIDEVVNSGAKITFVGLGCPRQEVFAYEFRDGLHMPILAVGAAFAFHAGVLPQAPPWMQRNGLEWFYRLTREPVRLWKRYVFLNPLYLLLLSMQMAGLSSPRVDDAQAPTSEYLYG